MKTNGNIVRMSAEPEPLEVDLARSAVVVVDMQNAFLEKGGLLDLAGLDISQASKVITAARETLEIARRVGLPIIYIQMGYPPDMSTAGGHQSPNPQKELALRLMKANPELKGKFLIWGTWDAEIIDEIAPIPGDIVIRKSRYNGFANTNLNQVLQTLNIKTLFFMGVATNVCVESTIRDAFFHEYWPVLISDATMQAGSADIQEASLFNIKTFFGWVTNSNVFKVSLTKGI